MASYSQRRSAFIGRWRVFHDGHKALIRDVYERKHAPVLVLVMDTGEDPPACERAHAIEAWAGDAQIPIDVMLIPPVEGVYYGRGVGYAVEQVRLAPDIEDISATKLLAAWAAMGV